GALKLSDLYTTRPHRRDELIDRWEVVGKILITCAESKQRNAGRARENPSHDSLQFDRDVPRGAVVLDARLVLTADDVAVALAELGARFVDVRAARRGVVDRGERELPQVGDDAVDDRLKVGRSDA